MPIPDNAREYPCPGCGEFTGGRWSFHKIDCPVAEKFCQEWDRSGAVRKLWQGGRKIA